MGIKRTVSTSTIRIRHQKLLLRQLSVINLKKDNLSIFLCKCLCNKINSRGSTSRPPRKLVLHFLDSGDIGYWDQLASKFNFIFSDNRVFFAFITLEFVVVKYPHHQKVIFVKFNVIKEATNCLRVKKVIILDIY